MPPKKTPVVEEEYVTIHVMTEMLEQQKLVYKDMLDLQEKNFKTFLQLFMETTNKRVDDLVKDFTEYKKSLDYTQAQVDEQKKTSDEMATKCREARTDINTVCQSALALDGKADYLEGQSKRNNVIIDGIPESQRESWEETEDKVRQILAEKLQMDEKRIEVERAHRTGDSSGDRPRPVVVKFLRWKDKAAIMARGNKLKGTNIYLNEDYSEAVRLRRK